MPASMRGADLESAMYRNPIIFSDYSDPDVIRFGDDFFMTSSSFNCFPALPILHSKDLVHWEIINHAIDRFPDEDFDKPQHGNGIWAPAFRYHHGEFYIFYGDPDRGIYMVKTRDVRSDWDPPVLVHKALGWIDPCPFWDDDGNAYLVHAFAKSRAGINSILHINRMSIDGTRLLDEGVEVFDGHKHHPTIEGPKLYKRNGFYYIFAPAGGVTTGWQTVLRSKHVYGPYEDKVVLDQGRTGINGPHQGGYVELRNGDGWFIHFQDRLSYGRIVHLQPVVWIDGWPVIGVDKDGDGTGEPVMIHRLPDVGSIYPKTAVQTSDDFNSSEMGLQWQWHANYQESWYSLNVNPGSLRLYSQPLPSKNANLWRVPGLLLQKFPAERFEVTTELSFHGAEAGDRAGLLIMGRDYSALVVQKTPQGLQLRLLFCLHSDDDTDESVMEKIDIDVNKLFLRVIVGIGASCFFSYSFDGKEFVMINKPFQALPGKWIGAKAGLFASCPADSKSCGFTDFKFYDFKIHE
jgi:beta-xylosidase